MRVRKPGIHIPIYCLACQMDKKKVAYDIENIQQQTLRSSYVLSNAKIGKRAVLTKNRKTNGRGMFLKIGSSMPLIISKLNPYRAGRLGVYFLQKWH